MAFLAWEAHIHAGARRQIALLATAAGTTETGGLLLGWWESNTIHVRHVVEVIDPAATATSWTRDEARAAAALSDALDRYEHPWLGYVGDWHTHPAPVGASWTDRRSIRRASRGYAEPLLLIVHRSDGTLDLASARRGLPVRVTEQVHSQTDTQQEIR